MLADLQALLAIPSVKDEATAGLDAPCGQAVAQALDYMLELARSHGMITEKLEGIVGYAAYGGNAADGVGDRAEDDGYVAVLTHLDVVPPGDGWTSPPFEPQIREGRLYARGALDDKGPAMASLYALLAIQSLGLPLRRQVRLIWGTDEESGMSCMDAYNRLQPAPIAGFTPDADFPVIHAEKGQVNARMTLEPNRNPETPESPASLRLLSFRAGRAANMVPDEAEAVISGPAARLADIAGKYGTYLRGEIGGSSEIDEGQTGEADDPVMPVEPSKLGETSELSNPAEPSNPVEPVEQPCKLGEPSEFGESVEPCEPVEPSNPDKPSNLAEPVKPGEPGSAKLILRLHGRSVHGMVPHEGINAGLRLLRFLRECEWSGAAHAFVRDLDRLLFDDFEGRALGIAGSDELTGPLTVNASLFAYEPSTQQAGVHLNIRHPIGMEPEEIVARLSERLSAIGWRLEPGSLKRPHAVPADHPLVTTLQRVYREQTGQPATLLSTGGGTYAAKLASGVAFGPLFPGEYDSAHQPDESIALDSLFRATALYARAIYELANGQLD